MQLTLWSGRIVDCIKFAAGPVRRLMMQFTRRSVRVCYDFSTF